MKTSKFTEAQIAFALKQGELGTKVDEVYRKLGIGEADVLQLEEETWGAWPIRVTSPASVGGGK